MKALFFCFLHLASETRYVGGIFKALKILVVSFPGVRQLMRLILSFSGIRPLQALSRFAAGDPHTFVPYGGTFLPYTRATWRGVFARIKTGK